MFAISESAAEVVAAVSPLQVGPLLIDPHNSVVQVNRGRYIPLTRFEMQILLHLAKNPGEIVSKDCLYTTLYPGVRQPSSNGLEVFVGRIRRKIDPANTLRPIQTVRYSGYRLRSDWRGTYAPT